MTNQLHYAVALAFKNNYGSKILHPLNCSPENFKLNSIAFAVKLYGHSLKTNSKVS